MTTPKIRSVEDVTMEALKANVPETKRRISLCMIVRNAEDTIRQCLASVAPYVDEIVIVFAGESEDGTVAAVSEMFQHVEPGKLKTFSFEWIDDFAAARNFSFSKATGDWYFWVDSDDIVEHGEKLHEVVATAEKYGFGSVHLPYEYRHDDRGLLTVVHTRERLLRRDLGWTWSGRVHEACDASTEHLVAAEDGIVVRHTSDIPKTERNMRLLRLMEQDEPENMRVIGSLAEHLQSEGKFAEAIPYHERFFDNAPNIEMRWHTACEMARCYLRLQDPQEAKRWCLTAMTVEPKYSLPYILMAHAIWYGEQDAESALLYLRDSESRLEAPMNVFRQPQDYTINRWDVEHRCYAAQENWKDAQAICGKALTLMPEAKEWVYFFLYYSEQVWVERDLAALEQLADHIFRRGDTLRARKLVTECVPLSTRMDPRFQPLIRRVMEQTAHVFDDGRYLEFYQENHSSLEDRDHAVNGTQYETYRLDPLIARLKARGAKKILDVGCGAGAPSLYLAEHGFEVVGLDINKAAIKEAKKAAKLKHLPTQFREGTLDLLGPTDLGHFDAVVMMELIEHILPSRTSFYLGVAEDLLRPGGAVFLTTPGMAIGDIPGLWEDFPRDHVIEFSHKDLVDMITGLPGDRTILSLHRLYDDNAHAPGFANWLVEYEMGAELDEPVVIYAGPGLEDWSPDYPEQVGIGGSETWVVKVAREFRKMGHPVIVYSMADGVWDGVVYHPYDRYTAEGPFVGHRAWLTIVSRFAEILAVRPNSEHVLFMAHDTDYGDTFTPEEAVNCDRVLVLSEWHKKHFKETYPWLTEGKLAITANGIEPELFGPGPVDPLDQVRRVPHSFIWSSSPDRGLDVLLSWWPEIRALWADATLDIFYGWQNIDRSLLSRPWLPRFKEKVLQLTRQPGITWHGRIGQKRLAEEMQKHQFWLYPSQGYDGTPWFETYCITALEAQAGGCIPIVPRVGALPERIYNGTVVDADHLDIERVIGILREWDDMGYAGNPEPVFENTWQKAAESILEALAPTKALAAV